ncbi:hypothetical protein LQR30_10305 [Chromobacterium piscinae]|uniref:hypothetical protein n=1 Tax=Chromobacterium piscinae TaxID=686831 RepID=UPI001E530DB7|nr:hypothetical protein [Chromobacterium piscinae]MCD4504498.1 hypothetical protein [Chromobacterium piscinae]
MELKERDVAKQADIEYLTGELRDSLTKLYGPLLPSRELWKIFGYASPAAYRRARARKLLPVGEFEIEGRRGYFALTHDVARWLATQSSPRVPSRSEEDQEVHADRE